MSVLVNGMEMSKSCWDCKFANHDPFQTRCAITGWCYMAVDERPSDCPLVSVPTPHGWLIDADALKCVTIETLEALKKNPKMDRREMHLIAAFGTLGAMIDDAQTIIPADNDAAMEVTQNG